MEKDYSQYPGLVADEPSDGVLRLTIDSGPMNTMDLALHRALGDVWRAVDDDRGVRAVVLTGSGTTFSAGGDFDFVQQVVDDYDFRVQVWKDGRNLVQSMIDCGKPIVAAINGAAAGGGLASALLADITVAGRNVKLADGHTRFGVAANDHAVLIWPLLCGMAKAKYYLMTSASLTGEEAERIGLVTMAVDDDEVVPRALEIAERLAAGAPGAIRWTKIALNNWLKAAWPAFEASLAFGFAGLSGPEAQEGIAALRERRRPQFPTDSHV